jgi:DNA-directed RNA polymerase subunit RPC12/RpoP
VSFIKSRLRRVEAASRSSRCPECGLPPDGIGRIVYGERPEGSEEFCARCGRRVWFVIEVSKARGER